MPIEAVGVMSEFVPFNADFEDQTHSIDQAYTKAEGLRKKSAPQRRFKDISLLLSVTVNILISATLIVLLLSLRHSDRDNFDNKGNHVSPLVPPGIEEEILQPVQFGWEYYAATVGDMERVDNNWNAINPDLGVISIPHNELARWGIIPARNDPSDPTKGIHTLRAYHSLHCLKVIRHAMLQLSQGEKLDMRFGHAMHCLGSLLRDVVCYADNSLPLQTDDADFQYVRKCRNWAAMSEWAGQRTSCMTTNNEGVLDLTHQDRANCTRADGILIPRRTRHFGAKRS